MLLFISGIILTIASWILAWTHTLAFSPYYFPFLWVGFILFLNGLSELIYHDSLIKEMRWWFLLLFLFSIPLWWLFEYLNAFVQNWYYVFPASWSRSTEIIIKTISFATVTPAVYSLSFLVERFLNSRYNLQDSPRTITPKHSTIIVLVGIVMLYLTLAYPKIFFPLVWIAPLLIVDPFNFHFGFQSFLREIAKGKWMLIISFGLGTLITGFFWEMWNFYAFPKWFYTVPYVDFMKVFEMPILGFLGYIPFGLFVFSFTELVLGLSGRRTLNVLH